MSSISNAVTLLPDLSNLYGTSKYNKEVVKKRRGGEKSEGGTRREDK
jgi:hypothetical protein